VEVALPWRNGWGFSSSPRDLGKMASPASRHPNTNATTTIITTVAKITAWMMSPLVMVDRVAANERDPGGTMFQPGSPPSPKAPWANSSGTVSGSHGKIELGATFNWAAWKVSHLETRGLR